MKREIKFRVWDEEEKKFWLTDDGLYFCTSGDVDKRLAVSVTGFLKRSSRFSVMQYVGMNDKGGREIYEGDIVHVNDMNRAIEWRESGFYCTWSDYALNTCWFAGGGPKVVGNIYENPELIQNP